MSAPSPVLPHRLVAATALHRGDRAYQQDQVEILSHERVPGCVLAVLADGMGGKSGGRKASDQVVLTARQLFERFLPAKDDPAETLLAKAPARGVQLVMPRLGEPVEPAQVERVTPWWRSAGSPHAGDTVVTEAEALSVPKVAGWPLD